MLGPLFCCPPLATFYQQEPDGMGDGLIHVVQFGPARVNGHCLKKQPEVAQNPSSLSPCAPKSQFSLDPLLFLQGQLWQNYALGVLEERIITDIHIVIFVMPDLCDRWIE